METGPAVDARCLPGAEPERFLAKAETNGGQTQQTLETLKTLPVEVRVANEIDPDVTVRLTCPSDQAPEDRHEQAVRATSTSAQSARGRPMPAPRLDAPRATATRSCLLKAGLAPKTRAARASTAAITILPRCNAAGPRLRRALLSTSALTPVG